MVGQWLWLHDMYAAFDGDVSMVLKQALTVGATGVLVKYHEGAQPSASNGDDFQAQFRALVGPLHSVGLLCAAWGYNYADLPEQEAQLIAQSFADGADWYCFDAESEFEGQTEAAQALVQAVRALLPTQHLAYTSFAYATDHPQFPYSVFDSVCQLFIPQVYWADLEAASVDAAYDQCFFSLYPLDLHAPIQPAGQIDGGATAEQVLRFVWLCQNGRIPGISFWALDDALPADLSAMAESGYRNR